MKSFSAGVRLAAALAFVVGALLAFATGPALAAGHYTMVAKVGEYSGSGVGRTFFPPGPEGVAVDPQNGDFYVVDGGNMRIDKFDSVLQANFLFSYGWHVEGGNEFQICRAAASCTFGFEGSEPGQFGGKFGASGTGPVGVAVDPVNHDAYVTDTFNNRVEYFEEEGPFAGQFNGSGTPAGAFSAPRGIAVDSSGHVYVEDTGNDVIDRFSAGGIYECQITGMTVGSATECDSFGSATPDGGLSLASDQGAGLAVDSSGDVYVTDTGHNVVDEFSPLGGFKGQFGAGTLTEPQALAVDSAGDVFVVAGAGSNTVYAFAADGSKLDQFGSEAIGQSYGLAAHSGRVYVTDRENEHQHVYVFAIFPQAITAPATEITLGGATLNGTVNPEGESVTECVFEYGENDEAGVYNKTIPCEQSTAQVGTGTSPVAVTAKLKVEPDAEIHYRLHAANASGSTNGAEKKFTAIEPFFGFQLGGPFALAMNVSNSGTEHEGEQGPANPGDLNTQAGSHPFDVTSRFIVNTESDGTAGPNLRPKDFYVNIPAGFAGSVARIPRCRMSELTTSQATQSPPGCPTATQVGVIMVVKGREAGTTGVTAGGLTPVYNMVPPPGVPAELAFAVVSVGVPVTFQVRSDTDYGITAQVPDVSEVLPSIGSQLTLWGVPADPRHDAERFLPDEGQPGNGKGEPLPAGTPEVPFLTNPTSCGEKPPMTVTGDSWLHPGKLAEDGRPIPSGENWVSVSTPMFPNGITGCEKLTFKPTLEVTPDTTVADSPAGLTVDLKVPQSENVHNYATPSLKDATVTLPAGLSISPSQATGLEGCTPEEIALGSMREPSCPNASQVGKLEVVTPLLPEPLMGRIYLSSERSGNTFHIYVVIEGQGVLIKLKGSVQANEQTGQLTSTFDENPQTPFSELKLTFYGGPKAALATPMACGNYTTTSLLEPWSQEGAERETGKPIATPSPFWSFAIGSGCTSGFSPGFKAGTENPVAGGYSPFSLTVSRNDGEQELSGLQVSLPKGLVGKLAGISECSNAQIAHAEHNTGAAEKVSPSCPANSLLGTVQAGAGPGEAPFFVSGRAYLTGPYKGAPYGVVVVVPALAGPFDLGTVVVRAAIHIDPHTAQVTVTSDPLPRMLDGIPLQVRRIEVSVSRRSFTLNPTSCESMHVSSVLSSFEGAQHAASARFQVGECSSLSFKPGFKVATHAKHSRRAGEYLRVNVTSGPGQANIRSVYVELPRALPSRLSTLKLACSAKQFAEDPAGCPAASHVGTAVARTPILSTPLTGPAIFVSHGGAAFPDLDIVLQGSGITVDLTGNTNIVKGITSSSFKSVPDVPVSSFQLTLPAGKHSALDANGSLCYRTITTHKHKVRRRVKLVMPTTITGQNGAQIKQNTVISVEGCTKRHKTRRRK